MDLTAQQSLPRKEAELEQYFKQHFVDLAGVRVGGKAQSCSDDFFAPMSNLLKPGRGVFIEDKYTDRGKWMDGWESRRSYGRTPPRAHVKEDGREFDWCIIALGIPGNIQGFDIDTNYFRGNAPQSVSIEGCYCEGEPKEDTKWELLLPETKVTAHRQNPFQIKNDGHWTHVRLNIFPDGGVARLRVYGEAVMDWTNKSNQQTLDLAAIVNGAKVLQVSDMFFSDKNNLIMPGKAKNMGDGWETKRRRDPGPDWSIIQLAHRGFLEKIIVDTQHFKGNFPDRFLIEGLDLREPQEVQAIMQGNWQCIIAETHLNADSEHSFEKPFQIESSQPITHIRLSIFPDGGVARLRVFGQPYIHTKEGS